MNVISRELACAAVDAGKAWAKGLKVGDTFWGARPAAEAKFPGDKTAQDYFVVVALNYLPQVIMTDQQNVIVEIDNPLK